jgi:4-hydroxy 2-oxovalerate aldolase
MGQTAAGLQVRVTDSTLRDGSHAVAHRFSEKEVVDIVHALDQAEVPLIEVSHGDGLGGSSFTYGHSRVDERALIARAVDTAKKARIAVLLIPGIGTMDDMRAARDLGAAVVRIATHATEADISVQHFELARRIGLETVGFLMMAHTATPDRLAGEARIMADAGAECVYITDSAGALVPDRVTDRIGALRALLPEGVQIGFHGHQNLSLALANTIAAVRAGAEQVDACSRGLGAGAGNTPTEALATVFDRIGINTGIDIDRILDVAEDVVRPIMDREQVVDRSALVMGSGGVYSSFLRHAHAASEHYGVPVAAILRQCAARRLVGGQEDQIIDIAVELAARPGSIGRVGSAGLQAAL